MPEGRGLTARFAAWQAVARYPSIDGLRCLAIVPVVWHHATPGPLDGVLGRGPLGVDLFFVVSGFLITTLLLRERERTGRVAVPSFFARRGLRIFPLYYLVLALFVLHAVALRAPGPERDHFLANLPWFSTYTSNWLVDFAVPHAVVFAYSWSLATEEQFYLVWPFALSLPRPRLAALVSAGALVVVDQLAERGALDAWLGPTSLALRVLRSLATPIGLGALLAVALRVRPTFSALDAVLGRRWSAPAALAVLALAAALAWPVLVAQAAMVALVAACSLRPDHGLAALTDARVVRHVGVVSYGMYLVNVPVMTATRALLGPLASSTALVFVVGLAGTVGVATLTYALVERPLLTLRARFRSEAARPSSGAAEPVRDVAGGRDVAATSRLPPLIP